MAQNVSKERLIADAARALFFERGYDTTSMDQVARRAGVSKATVYAHFESKEKLLLRLIQDEVDSLPISAQAPPPATAGELTATLRGLAQQFATMFEDPRTAALHRLVIAQAHSFDDIAQAFYEAGPLRMEREVARHLRHGVDKGLLRITDIELAATHFLSLVVGTLPLRSILSLPLPSPESWGLMVEAGLAAFLAAYGAEKGPSGTAR